MTVQIPGEPIRVLFDWDYGYSSPLRAPEHIKHSLTQKLRDELRAWLDVFETGNPSDPGWPPLSWLAQGRTLKDRVQEELGPGFEVVFVLDRNR